MRRRTDEHSALFHTFCVENRIRADHPLRDAERIAFWPRSRPNSPSATAGRGDQRAAGRLPKAQLLLSLDSIRSERRLCERIAAI